MCMKIIKKTVDVAGRTLSLEVGRFAQQASAAVVAQYGETIVLATVTASSRETTLDYFPLSVEYIERLYAGGRIKGSRWVKREGSPSDDAVLSGRLIDRSIRPLFPKNYKHDVQVIITTLSVDGENDPDVLSLVATSAAIAISPIPWNGPVSAVRVGYTNGDPSADGGNENKKGGIFLINPRATEQELSDFDFVISSNKENVMMLEGGFCETPEDVVMGAVVQAKEENANIITCIEELVKAVGKTKAPVPPEKDLKELEEKIIHDYKKEVEAAFQKKTEKEYGDTELSSLAQIIAVACEQKYTIPDIMGILDGMFKKKLREDILKKGKRVDGRKADEIRPITMEVGILPRTHGSAMFARGQTQVLTIATLASPELNQLIESPTGEESKRYIHHYSMPPYSVGETGRVGTPSRREIGHGALAERALLSVIPSEEEFPYTIGLMTDKKSDTYVLLTDIMGVEDFGGDMDFKVAGTKNGITAIQLDMKINGITDEMVRETLEKARIARLFILDKLHTVIGSSRGQLSQYAPKVQMVKIPVEKIGEVIGPGGKMIRQIQTVTGAVLDVKDDGSVFISSIKEEAVKHAVSWIEGLTHEVKPQEEYEGEVKRMLPFGAFVEILPGKEGLVHVSQMSTGFVNTPSEVVSLGQKVKVRVMEIDDQGRVNLSMLFGEDAKKPVPSREPRTFDRPRRTFGGPRRRF